MCVCCWWCYSATYAIQLHTCAVALAHSECLCALEWWSSDSECMFSTRSVDICMLQAMYVWWCSLPDGLQCERSRQHAVVPKYRCAEWGHFIWWHRTDAHWFPSQIHIYIYTLIWNDADIILYAPRTLNCIRCTVDAHIYMLGSFTHMLTQKHLTTKQI